MEVLHFAFRVVLYPMMIQTFFVPDEYWQSLEVAHYLTFGYGHLTWEWFVGLRSYFYPIIFMIPYRIMYLLGIDTVSLITILPKIMSGMACYVMDVLVFKLVEREGEEDSWGIWICWMTNWYHFYSGARTLSNSIEGVLTICAVTQENWLFYAGLGCLIRPTNALFWIPYLVFWKRKDLGKSLYYGAIFVVYSFLLDSLFYGWWTSSFLEFFRFNFLTSNASFYGTHPIHWYFSNAIPTMLGFQMPFLIVGLCLKESRKWDPYLFMSLFVIAVYSILGHKEFRFIYPTLPFLMIYTGKGFSWLYRRARMVCWLLIFCNLLMAGYFSLLHQRGTLDVVHHLAKQDLHGQSILVLMPCHATPGYSDLHQNVPFDYLDCSPITPTFGLLNGTLDSSDAFHGNPEEWIISNDITRKYTRIIMFEHMYEKLKHHFHQHLQIQRFFHTLLVMDSKQSQYVVLLTRTTAH